VHTVNAAAKSGVILPPSAGFIESTRTFRAIDHVHARAGDDLPTSALGPAPHATPRSLRSSRISFSSSAQAPSRSFSGALSPGAPQTQDRDSREIQGHSLVAAFVPAGPCPTVTLTPENTPGRPRSEQRLDISTRAALSQFCIRNA